MQCTMHLHAHFSESSSMRVQHMPDGEQLHFSAGMQSHWTHVEQPMYIWMVMLTGTYGTNVNPGADDHAVMATHTIMHLYLQCN